jgi:uncharacterized membrane protein YczE
MGGQADSGERGARIERSKTLSQSTGSRRPSGTDSVSLLRRWLRLLAGLAVFAIGLALMVRARLGLSPWDVLHEAIDAHTALSFGQVVIVVSIAVVALGWLLGVRPGLGTVANSILVGLATDLFLNWRALDRIAGGALPFRLLATLLGVAAIALGTAIYVGADLGAGPRDGLMLGVARVTSFSPGAARVVIEASVLVGGVLLGGTVGIGTVTFVVAIGPAINASFRLFGMEEADSNESLRAHRRRPI